jgi:peptidyl-prolyl cis-trans isomerase SurA
MRTTKLIILFTLLLILFALAPGYLLAEITNRIVATVNSDIITLHDLNVSIKRLTGLSAKDLQLKNEKEFYEIRRAILDNLVNEKITEQQIIKLGIKVTAKNVDEAIEKVKRENNFTQEELIYSLKLDGVTLEEYKDKIEKQIERFRLVNYEVKSKIVITEEEIKKYYQTHSKEYTEISKVRLARIFLRVRNPNDKEEIARVKSLGVEILQKIKQGHDFSEMAKTYSQGPAGPEGGNLGWIKASQLEPTLRKKIDKLSVGEHTDLDLAPSGFQIIRLVEEKKGGLKPFEEIRDAIYSKLFKEKVEKRYATWLNKLRKESFIKITF